MFLWLCVVLSVLQSAIKAAPDRMFMENYTQLISLNHCNKEEHPIPANWDAADSLFTKVKFCSWGCFTGRERNKFKRSSQIPTVSWAAGRAGLTHFRSLPLSSLFLVVKHHRAAGKHQHASAQDFWVLKSPRFKITHPAGSCGGRQREMFPAWCGFNVSV